VTRPLERGSGLLLPVFSLPSLSGIGDLGPAACDFADRLADAGQRYWQLLPANPVSAACGYSPYHAVSAFALNPLFICPELLAGGGHHSSPPGCGFPDRIDYPDVVPRKEAILRNAAEEAGYGRNDPEFPEFSSRNSGWLDDFALFSALSRRYGECWTAWPRPLRDRDAVALAGLPAHLMRAANEVRYIQYLAFSQWSAFHDHCRDRGVKLIGDLPLYMAHGSADAWARRELFRLSADGTPLAVAGVPPDYFSSEGQFWGNPVYDWEEMEMQHFSWWRERVGHALGLCDLLRIDHFRGLSACWEIPAGSTHPSEGHWAPVPGRELLAALGGSALPLLAEDLGVITPDVRDLMREFEIPGMRVLQFGFSGEPDNLHAPERIDEDVVLYTGTHDNNTLLGWFTGETGPAERERIAAALGSLPGPPALPREMISLALGSLPGHSDLPAAMIHLALRSPARVVIVPVQDLLGLPSTARMNRPGTTGGNWSWRLPPGLPCDGDWAWLAEMTARTGRGSAPGT
jgi:4-alpha-glucanotransferase